MYHKPIAIIIMYDFYDNFPYAFSFHKTILVHKRP